VIGRAGLRNHRPQRSYTGRGRIKFLGSDLHDCSLASSCSSPRLVYLFVGRAPRVVAFNTNSVRSSGVFIQLSSSRNRKSRTVQIMSYIFNMLIYVGMILLDNLLQCLSFIAMIDLSCTCDSAASLICYALIMFIIYSWIKIKLKVLIFSTV
jgi:hypothetical protein